MARVTPLLGMLQGRLGALCVERGGKAYVYKPGGTSRKIAYRQAWAYLSHQWQQSCEEYRELCGVGATGKPRYYWLMHNAQGVVAEGAYLPGMVGRVTWRVIPSAAEKSAGGPPLVYAPAGADFFFTDSGPTISWFAYIPNVPAVHGPIYMVQLTYDRHAILAAPYAEAQVAGWEGFYKQAIGDDWGGGYYMWEDTRQSERTWGTNKVGQLYFCYCDDTESGDRWILGQGVMSNYAQQ